MSICNKSKNTYMEVRYQIQATVASGGRKGPGEGAGRATFEYSCRAVDTLSLFSVLLCTPEIFHNEKCFGY